MKSSSNIIDKLKDNQGRQYFFKNAKKYGYLIKDEQLEIQEISKKDNLSCSLNVDCEYTQLFCSSPKKITLEELRNNPNRWLSQVSVIDQMLGFFPALQNTDYLSKEKKLRVNGNHLKQLEHVKTARTLNLTTQFKHVLHEDSEILVNPEIKNFYEENIEDNQYIYPYYDSKGCQFIDFLKLKGFKDIKIERKEEIRNKKKMPKLTIKLFGYYMIADLCKIFGGEYLEDIKEAMLKGKISLKRRLAASGFHRGLYTNWVTTLNNIEYQTVIELVDFGGIHGIASFSDVLTNLGMNTDDKGLLDDLKDNMLLAMIDRPADFKRYAIGDLQVYEAGKKHNVLLRSIYESQGVLEYFIESKLTTGAYTNDLQEAILLKLLDYSPEELEEILDKYNRTYDKKLKKLSIRQLLKLVTYTASPQYMKSYININTLHDADYKKHIGSKTMGGRCNPNRLLTTSIMSGDYSICDIDISGAYSTIYNNLNYYFGHPVTLGFSRHKVTLREFYKKYKNDLVKRGFKLMVETKDPLTIEQDIFPSWTNLTFKREKVKTAFVDDNFRHLIGNDNINEKHQMVTSVDLNATNNDIFTTELHNATLTSDDLDCMFNEVNKKQREEMLDKLYMQTAIFYPASMECKSIEEFKKITKEHDVYGKYRYVKEMLHSKIDNKSLDKGNFWVGVNFGKIIGEQIKIARAINKKINPSLANMYKTIGNTLYGINVSQYFISSNIVLAANITSMCRIGMWYVEKALNIHQTITDGGIFDLNKVPHLIYKKMDTASLVRAYRFSDRELANNNKWNTRPVTNNGSKITYTHDKGWFMDDVNYTKDNISKLYSVINQTTMAHIQKIFPYNSLLNDTYKHVRIDNEGNSYYEDKKGLFEFEVKALTHEASFHGAANYYYHDSYKNEDKFKMRGYESKKTAVAYSLNENNNLVADVDYYKTTKVIEMFLKNINENPESVELLPPFIKPLMLKVNQHRQQYKKTYRHSKLMPGDETYELVTVPLFTLRFKFMTRLQKKLWVRYYTSLKNRFGGLSFEVFFMNEDGTCNYKKMLHYIDDLISKGETDPKKIFDPHNNLGRDIKNPYILKRIELMRQLKNKLRILNVGVTQYCKENFEVLEYQIAA